MKLFEELLKLSFHIVYAFRIEFIVRFVGAQIVGKKDAHIIETGHFELVRTELQRYTQAHTIKRHFKLKKPNNLKCSSLRDKYQQVGLGLGGRKKWENTHGAEWKRELFFCFRKW